MAALSDQKLYGVPIDHMMNANARGWNEMCSALHSKYLWSSFIRWVAARRTAKVIAQMKLHSSVRCFEDYLFSMEFLFGARPTTSWIHPISWSVQFAISPSKNFSRALGSERVAIYHIRSHIIQFPGMTFVRFLTGNKKITSISYRSESQALSIQLDSIDGLGLDRLHVFWIWVESLPLIRSWVMRDPFGHSARNTILTVYSISH